MVPGDFVAWLMGFLIALLGGCWGIFKYFESQLMTNKKETSENIKRLYERMDENKTSYYNDFVLTKVFKERNDAMKELNDSKYQALVQLFNEKIESLRTEIRTAILNSKNHQQ